MQNFSRVDATLVCYTVDLTILMQLIIASNRLSAVSAKQNHDVIFSRRNAIILIVLSALLAAISSIPALIYGLEINPYIMNIWFISEPSFAELFFSVNFGITFGIVITVMTIYVAAYVKLRYSFLVWIGKIIV